MGFIEKPKKNISPELDIRHKADAGQFVIEKKYQAAREAALKINDPKLRAEILQWVIDREEGVEILQAQCISEAQKGNIEEAKKIADKISNKEIRGHSYQDIVAALLEKNDFVKAKEIARTVASFEDTNTVMTKSRFLLEYVIAPAERQAFGDKEGGREKPNKRKI